MKSERLFRILGLIDDDLIEEVEPAFSPTVRRKQRRWLPVLAAAACLMVTVGLIWRHGGLPISLGGGSESGSSSSSSSAGSAADTGDAAGPSDGAAPSEPGGSGIAHDTEPVGVEGASFMSYAGPLFPLTTLEETEGLTVERKTTWNFAPGTYQDGAPRQWGAAVSERYTLMNASTGEILALAGYPVAASFADLNTLLPTVTADGEAVEPTLYAGAYAGGFTHAGIEDGSTWNLDPPHSWTDYKTLLEDGAYFEQAMGEHPELDRPVTVYEFTDLQAPEGYDAATLALDCTIDPDETTILSYGFNGFWMEDDGWRRYDFFVPSAIQQNRTYKMLIVLGEDIDGYTLQGYQNGACEPDEELDAVSCTVRRRETTLGEALDTLCRFYMEEYQENLPEFASIFDLLTPELFQGKTAELMAQHGPSAGTDMKDRYSEGRLGDLISETMVQERVLYLVFPVTIPAGESVDITIDMWKAPSYDFGCSDSENVGLQGYDYVATLGSTLEFTSQTASLVNTDGIELAGQNFGFDLENGVTEVALDPVQEYYYLEIRPKEG